MTHKPIIEMRGISKRFGQVQANAAVDFTLRRGEIHAIVGENGAGKSTLMKILYGLYQPDAGELAVNGHRVDISSTRRAMRLGLGMIQQHFTLIPVFTALQNIILAKEPRKFRAFLNYQKAEAEVMALAAQLGFQVPLNTPIESLPIGAQQHTEILKALYHGAEILIMDEPTAVLAPQEIEGLFRCMHGLRQEGKSLVIITHKLDEVMAIADTVTVMRRGKTVASLPTAKTDATQLAELMLGEPVARHNVAGGPQAGGRREPTASHAVGRGPVPHQAPLLRLENVTVQEQQKHKSSQLEDRLLRQLKALRRARACPSPGQTTARDNKNATGRALLQGITLEVHRGEIVGIAGVEGNGQTELVEALTGLRQIHGGTLTLNGEAMREDPALLREKGVAHLPADRHRHGISLNDRLDENFIIGRHRKKQFSRYGLLQHKSIQRFAANALAKYDIRVGDIAQPIRTLSGGNQQKVVVARELAGGRPAPELIIAAHPTRGLDIHAARFVHTRLFQARNSGKAILLVSSELEELLHLSDRIAVMFNGQIAGIVKPEETDMSELGALMLGLS